MTHPSHDELRRFLGESLDSNLNQQIDKHLDSCRQCRDVLDQIIKGTLSSLPATETKDGLNDQTAPSQLVVTSSESAVEFDFDFSLRYVVSKEIARGGMGIIYQGFDRDFQREIAIKVAKSSYSGGAARFSREARISGQLQHPGVVPVHEMGQLADGRYFIVMRLIKGETFQAILDGDTLGASLAGNLDVFGQVCQTMAYAHSKNFIHRDLKPENIMVGAFGEVQIMDWGLARKLDRDDAPLPADRPELALRAVTLPTATAAGQVMGTPAYMPPEQAKGDTATKRSDVFALGGILFQILTGKAPFDAATSTRAVAKSVAANLAESFAALDRSSADVALKTIVKSCLAANPLQRPADAVIVSEKFSQYIQQREEQRKRSQLGEARLKERLIAQQKRNRQLAWSAGAIVATLAVSAAAGMMYLSEKNARIANQAKVDQERIEKTVADEIQIREILATAADHRRLAQERDPVKQSGQWILARKEIEKAQPLISEFIDPELLKSYRHTADRIVQSTKKSILISAEYQLEQQCAQRIRQCCEQNLYPTELENAIPPQQPAASQLSSIFKEVNITETESIEESATRIINSRLKNELLLGLLVWQHELRLAPVGSETTVAWLEQLIANIDSDPFREKLRSAFADGDVDLFVKLIKSKDAVGSLLTVHTIANLQPHIVTEPTQQLRYVRRAQRKFPEDFLANWYPIAFASGDRAIKNEHALACYSLRPENPGAMWSQGEALVNQRNYIQAIDVLQKLLRLAPHFADAHAFIAYAYGRSDQPEKAIEHFDLALKYQPNSLTAIRLRGDHFYHVKNYKAAETDLVKLHELNEGTYLSNRFLSNIYYGSGRLMKAIECIDRLIGYNRLDPAEYQRLRRTYWGLIQRRRSLGRNEAADQDFSKAIRHLTELAQQTPDFAQPHEEIAWLYHFENRPRKAIDAQKKAILLDPDAAPRKEHLLRICAAAYGNTFQGEPVENAISYLTDALDFLRQQNYESPKMGNVYSSLAQHYRIDKQFDNAVQAMECSYELLPDSYSHKIQLALIYQDAGTPERADEIFRELLEDGKERPGLVFAVGMYLIRNGSPERAEAHIREALENAPNETSYLVLLAKALAVQAGENGKSDKGLECMELLRKMRFPDDIVHSVYDY